MSATSYAVLALPVLYGAAWLFGAVRIHRHDRRLGVLSFLLFPVGVYATVRYWRADHDNPRVPALVALALCGVWLGMLAFAGGPGSNEGYAGDSGEYARGAEDDATPAGVRGSVSLARLPYRRGVVDLADVQAQIDVPTHFRFVSAAALRAAGLSPGAVPHAKSIGWIVHEGVDLAAGDAWYIEVDWFGEGFVGSERLTAYGNAALLAEARATAARVAATEVPGHVELVRFAETPVFDVSDARLTWVAEADHAGERVLDCHAVKLGRSGALQFSIASMALERSELCLRAVRLAAASSRFNANRAFADYSRLFDSKSPFDLVDLVTGRHWLPDP
jgi:uncharacterized membrane-anchored protein